MLKRCLSLILAFVMVFSLLPVQALAEGTPETEGEVLIQETQVHEADPEPETEPVSEPETEPVTEPETEPVTEPETEPVTEPETEPVTEPETEPAPAETEPAPAKTKTACQHVTHSIHGSCNNCGELVDHVFVDGTCSVCSRINCGHSTFEWMSNHFECSESDCYACLTENCWHELDKLNLIALRCSKTGTTEWITGWDIKTVTNITGTHATGITCDGILTAFQISMLTGHNVIQEFNETDGYTHTSFSGIPAGDLTIKLTWDAASQKWTCEPLEFFCTCEGGTPVTYAAEIGATRYATAQRAITFASAHDTVKLIAECADMLTFSNKNIALDLNGYNVTNGIDIVCSTVELRGEGEVHGDVFIMDPSEGAEPSHVTIKGGTYKGSFSIESGCVLTITGGTFAQDVSNYVASGSVCTNNGDGTWTVVTETAEPESNSVTFTFNVIGHYDIVAPITATLGESIVPPNCTYENPGFTFNGWILNRSDGAMLSIYGTFVSDGNNIATINADEPFYVNPELFDPSTYSYNFSAGWRQDNNGGTNEGSDAYVEDEAGLRGAIDACFEHIWIDADITLTDVLTLPEDTILHIMDGATLTVPANIVMNVYGHLYVNNGMLKIAEGGILRTFGVNAWIRVDKFGKLNASGADLSGVGTIGVMYSSHDQIIGVPANILEAEILINSFAQMKESLSLADNFRLLSLNISGDITITEDLELPRNVSLHLMNYFSWDEETQNDIAVSANVTIAPGATVTTYSYIGINNDCSLTVSEGACLNSFGYLGIYSDARVVNNGTITATDYGIYEGAVFEGNEITSYKEPGLTEEQLREALNFEASEDRTHSVHLTDDITLTGDLTIPMYHAVYVESGATLTIPAGKTLTIEGDLYIDGTVKVAPGARIRTSGDAWPWIGIWSGTLDLTGADISGLDFDRVDVDFGNNGKVLGVPTTDLNGRFEIHNFEEMKTAVAQAGMYNRLDLNIHESVTVTEDLEIPDNIYMILWNGYGMNGTVIPGELIIASGVNLTTHGNIQVGDESILNVSENAQLTVYNYLHINSTAKIINNGTIYYAHLNSDYGYSYEGSGQMIKQKAPGMNEEQLRAALSGEETWIDFTGEITLTQDLYIPRDYTIYMREAASITVPAGISLIVEGSLYIEDGIVTVEPGASFVTIDNDWLWITVGYNGHLDLTGADLTNADISRINLDLVGGSGTISGVPSTALQASARVETLDDVRTYLAMASQYHHLNVSLVGNVTVTEDLKIPSNAGLQIDWMWKWDDNTDTEYKAFSNVTVAPGVKLENRGHIYVSEGCTLTVSEGSELYCSGSMYIGSNGTLINDGIIHERNISYDSDAIILGNGQWIPYETPPMTEDELHEELRNNGVYLDLTGNMTLTRDLTIPDNDMLELVKGSVLTVPAGITLTIDGYLYISNGMLKVEEGGILKVTGPGLPQVGIFDNGVLDATGADVSGVNSGTVYFWLPNPGNIHGIPAEKLTAADDVTSYTSLVNTLAEAENYHAVYAECQKSMTISKDVYIPENAIVEIYPTYSNTGKVTPTKITISSGASVFNDGVIFMADSTTLTINSGCELYNGAGVLEVGYGATLVNNGTVTSNSEYYHIADGATVKGTGKLRVIEELTEISSADKIMEAYENGSTVLRIVDSNIEFTESTTLPKDLELEFIGSTVTIAEGVTVTCETNRALSFMAGSKLYLNGAIDAKEIFVDDLNGVIPPEKIVSKVKAPVGGWYIKLGIPKVESLTILVDGVADATELDVDMKYKPTAQLSVTSAPMYASSMVTWKSSSTSLATVNADGLVTFKKPGTVTITATAADGSKVSTSVKFNVTYLDPAAKLTASAEVPEQGLEGTYDTVMKVFATDKENALNPLDLTFTSSTESVATVDENGVITAGSKAGTATITAAITGDPLNRKVSVKVKVIPLQAEALYLLPDDSERGLTEIKQTNLGSDEDPKFEVYLDKADLASGNYTFVVNPMAYSTKGEQMKNLTLKWVSADTKVATVAANDDGGATVTLKADGVSTISATTTTNLDPLTWEITVYVCDYMPRLDTTTVTVNSQMVTGTSIPLVESYGNTVEAVSIDDERLDASYADGMLTIFAPDFIAKNTTIKTTLNVLCKNGEPYPYNITVKIANSLPSITVKQPVKFNKYTGLSTDLSFTAKNAVVNDVVLVTGSTASFDQAADFNTETGVLTLAASDAHLSGEADMDAKIEVDVYLDGYRDPIRKAVTVSTSSTKPSITVKQTEKFNLFYTTGATTLQITAKDMVYDRIELVDTASFAGEYVEGTSFMDISRTYNGETKTDTSAKLLVYPVGYEKPIEKTFTISASTTKPSLALTPSSSTINTKLDSKTTFIAVYDKTYGGMVLSPEDVDITVTKDSKTGVEFATYEVVNGGIQLELTGNKGGTATIQVQLENWTQPIKLTHKVSVKDTMPAPVLGTSTLKLNRIFTWTIAETTATLNQSNYKISDIVFTPVKSGYDDIVLVYDDGIITAFFNEEMDPDAAPKNGNYKFYYEVFLDNEAHTSLGKKTITVNVSSTVPTVKLKTSSLKLNKNLGTLAAAETAVTMTKGDGYTLTNMALAESISDDIEIRFDATTGMFYVYLLNPDTNVTKHTISLHPVLKNNETGEKVTLSSVVTLKVEVKPYTTSASLSAKGKIDTMNPDSAINYIVSKLNNVVGDVYDVNLVDDLGLFDVELDTTGSKPVAVLTRKAGAEVATNKTYNLQLRFSVWVNTSEGIQSCDVINKVSFKASQSALKFISVPTQKLYLFQKELVTTVSLNTPTTATLGEITLNESKTAAAFKKALGDGAVTFELSEDGRSAQVHFAIEHPGYLVNGKSYTVYLDVTPADNATNVKPTQVKLTVKAYK